VISGSVAEWEARSGLASRRRAHTSFPALVPVGVDREDDLATYVEPNVWMQHPIRA
jgi:hypothetical protein